jgi:hypothetical protein
MIANDILLDAFTRVHESLQRTLGDITAPWSDDNGARILRGAVRPENL